MTEPKFRAWDSTRKRMLQVRQILIPDGNNENGLQEVSVSGLKFGTNPSHWLIAPPLMQYTGLKDKNGREIYEGDVVRTPSHHTGRVFDRLGCWFVEMGAELGYYYAPGLEVIGNVYENPDLMKGGSDV